MKLNLGCGPLPLHPQHATIMVNPDEWTLVDKYIDNNLVKNWDAEKLDEVEDGSCEVIYASHLLEHISHRRLENALRVWRGKLQEKGTLIINVPDIVWAARQIIKYEQGQTINDTIYNVFEGERGLQTIVYGSHEHEGEYHKAMFTKRSITTLLEREGYHKIQVDQFIDAHEMGVLFVVCQK